MSASSGVQVSDELKRHFADAATSDVGIIKIQIEGERFKQIASAADTGSKASNLAAIAPLLEARKPCYVAAKTETKDMWMLVFYVPDDSPVRDRMVYASSVGALKLGLGAAKFGQDYTIRDARECSPEAYEESKKKMNEEDLLTYEERMGLQTHSYVAASTDSVKMSGMSDLPMKSSDEAKAAIAAVLGGTSSAAVFQLDASETMQVQQAGSLDIAAVVRGLPTNQPRYAVIRFPHAHPETKEESNPTIFVYYCPDAAPPRMKMTYSTCKSMAVKTCDSLGLSVQKQLEISTASELSQQMVLDELYPKKAENKKFAKPAKPGRAGTKGLHRAAASP